MSKQPLVSVFIPYYNDEKFLRETIESVINQKYENWELFLFNHACTDNSRDIAHEFKDERIHHIDVDYNLGAGSGYNIKVTLPQMKGKYLKLFCADDKLKPTALEELVECMETNPDKDIVFADMDYINEEGKSLKTTWTSEIPMADLYSNEYETLKKFFKGYSHIAYPAAMIKTDAIKDIKLDYTLIMLFDVSLWIKLLIKDKKIIFLDSSIVDYRISDNQLSSAANLKQASKKGYLELFQLLDLYYEIQNIRLIKYLCPCKYSNMLQEGDEKFIPFIISYFFATVFFKKRIEYFKDQQSVREIYGCTRLHKILSDDNMRTQIEKKFGFGIKDFRAIYSYMYDQENSKNIHEHILNKLARNLSLLQIIYLFIRRLYLGLSINHQITRYLRKRKSKKQYTV